MVSRHCTPIPTRCTIRQGQDRTRTRRGQDEDRTGTGREGRTRNEDQDEEEEKRKEDPRGGGGGQGRRMGGWEAHGTQRGSSTRGRGGGEYRLRSPPDWTDHNESPTSRVHDRHGRGHGTDGTTDVQPRARGAWGPHGGSHKKATHPLGCALGQT